MQVQKMANRQRGMVLFISLIMLVVIGLLTMSLMDISRIEMRMSNNEEARINGLQMAQSLSDVIAAEPDMTPVVGGAGYTHCAGTRENCDASITEDLPENVVAAAVADEHLSAIVTRSTPEFRPPPRGLGWSAAKFVSTSFVVEATYDRTEDGMGHGSVEEGLVVMIPL